MLGLSRKRIVEISIISLFIAIYQVYGYPLWSNYIASLDAPLGVGETALGYAIVVLSAIIFSSFITKNMEREK